MFKDDLSIIEFSFLMGNFGVVQYLIENTKQDKNVKQHSLELACANQYIDLVKLFIADNVNINIASSKGKDWLCIFSSIKNVDHELFNVLIEKNVNLTVQNSAGHVPKEYLDSLKNSIKKFTIK